MNWSRHPIHPALHRLSPTIRNSLETRVSHVRRERVWPSADVCRGDFERGEALGMDVTRRGREVAWGVEKHSRGPCGDTRSGCYRGATDIVGPGHTHCGVFAGLG